MSYICRVLKKENNNLKSYHITNVMELETKLFFNILDLNSKSAFWLKRAVLEKLFLNVSLLLEL